MELGCPLPKSNVRAKAPRHRYRNVLRHYGPTGGERSFMPRTFVRDHTMRPKSARAREPIALAIGADDQEVLIHAAAPKQRPCQPRSRVNTVGYRAGLRAGEPRGALPGTNWFRVDLAAPTFI